jgi:rhodanese-related sulfurtransferase
MDNLISAADLYKLMDAKNVIMVDAEEYFGKEPNNLFGDIYYQYENLNPEIMSMHKDKNIVVYCNHGISSRFFARQLQAKYPEHKVMTLDGGSDALTKDAGMSCALNITPAKMTITRQICAIAGGIIVVGGMSSLVWPAMTWLTISVGAGLCVSGLTGWCALANILLKMPWNK